MDHFALVDGEQEITITPAGEMSITISGTGTVQLGFRTKTGAFQAYTAAEATMVAGDSTVLACGDGCRLMASVTGAGADLVANIAPVRA